MAYPGPGGPSRPEIERQISSSHDTYPCRLITSNVHSNLEAVGFLAAITGKLAHAGVSANAVSAFYHDHLFVSVENAEKAMGLLEELGAEPSLKLFETPS